MESVDCSPNYLKPIKMDNSEVGSECDDLVSGSSSTCESAVNGPYTPKTNSGINYRSNNKKVLRSNRSLQRRAKVSQSFIDMPHKHESAMPHNYLKSTSSSEGKKSHLSSSNASVNDASEQNSSNSSPIHKNVGILLKRASFKSKRPSLHYARASKGVDVERATYSSTLRDSKFSISNELHHEESENTAKICRYHHCSLHGHCHGSSDNVPPPKRFQYKRRRSMKKQKTVAPKRESSDKKKILPKMVQEEKVDSHVESRAKTTNESLGEGYFNIQNVGLLEIAFGETSFPERSYDETIDILKKHSSEKQDSDGLSGYCLKCSCSITEQITSGAEFSPDEANDSSPYESVPNESEIVVSVEENEKFDQDCLYESVPNESEIVGSVEENENFDQDCHENKRYVEENAEGSVEENEDFDRESQEGSDQDFPATPEKFDELTKNKGLSLASDSRNSSCTNSVVDGDFTAESINIGKSKDVQFQDSAISSPIMGGSKLQFSKVRHISMWNLIHQHMSSDSAIEGVNTPVVESRNQEEAADQVPPAKENRDLEMQEIEVRKLFAIKLVREAIEKILLPEVQDQTSDGQSTTGENTPRPEVTDKKNQIDGCIQECHEDSDATNVQQLTSTPNEENTISEVASDRNISKTGETVSTSKKNAPKHWSNLKKWILLQRFIKELEKVRIFNPRKPRYLPLISDPDGEKVNLRAQTVDERKRGEEWMLDYALRQAVNQLAPTQKRKVALLVKAFETVVPSQDDAQIPLRVPRSEDKVLNVVSIEEIKKKDDISSGNANLDSEIQESGTDLVKSKILHLNEDVTEKTIVSFTVESNATEFENDEPSLTLDGNGNSELNDKTLSSDSFNTRLQKMMGDRGVEDIQGESTEENQPQNAQLDKKNRIKLWHMIYQHVASGIVEKVGNKLLETSDEDEVDDSKSDSQNVAMFNDHSAENDSSNDYRSAFTKNDALKLVKEAVDEILLPEISDDSNDAQERNKFGPQKSKNWSKLKKLMLLKRSIRALQIGRKQKQEPELRSYPQVSSHEPEKVDLRNQMMDERKKAEQWMLDYAVQHIVTKLTPTRKKRVAMLVEAFEAIVPLPEGLME